MFVSKHYMWAEFLDKPVSRAHIVEPARTLFILDSACVGLYESAGVAVRRRAYWVAWALVTSAARLVTGIGVKNCQ